MAAYASSARSDPYGLTADDFVGPPMGHPRAGVAIRTPSLFFFTMAATL